MGKIIDVRDTKGPNYYRYDNSSRLVFYGTDGYLKITNEDDADVVALVHKTSLPDFIKALELAAQMEE